MDDLRVEVHGRVGRDPEMKYLANGTAVTTVSVAASRSYKKNEEWVSVTTWIRVTIWGKMGETAHQRLRKGDLVYVEGFLTGDENGNPRVYQKKDGTYASSFELQATGIKYFVKHAAGDADGDPDIDLGGQTSEADAPIPW